MSELDLNECFVVVFHTDVCCFHTWHCMPVNNDGVQYIKYEKSPNLNDSLMFIWKEIIRLTS